MADPSRFTEEQVTEALIACVAWGGRWTEASRMLKSTKGIEVTPQTLGNWCRETHAARYDELREKYSAQLEGRLIHEYRDVARQSVDVQRLALQKAHDRLEANEDQDPSRTAANAARVAQTMTDKMLSLSGRPTSIREDRNLQEVLRSLAAKKIIELPDSEVSEEPQPELPEQA